MEEISLLEVASGFGPTPQGLWALGWVSVGLRGQSLASSLGLYLPGKRELSLEIGSSWWFCLGLPEPKAGARGQGANSGTGACVPHLLSGILLDKRLVCKGGRCPVGTHCQRLPPPPQLLLASRDGGVCVCQEVSPNLGGLDDEGE